MNRDTFCTRAYKSGFIHTCYDRDLKREIVHYAVDEFSKAIECKSYRSAQIHITRARKEVEK